ncbi:MAG: AMP-dependent synthetase [Actinomycetia bacterium]|nr:AMP-dependent synthetase [Actinomycetes bacterium]
MNLARALLATAEREPGRTALRFGDTTVTFGELAARSARTAGLLSGLAPAGARVALVLGNEPAFVAGYLGALGAGAIAVPCNPTAPFIELRRELDTVGAAVVVTSPASEAIAVEAAGDRKVVVLTDDGPDAAPIEFVERAPADAAALLFTSGTAGPPRPAVLTHGSLLANLEQVQRHPGLALTPDDVGLGVLPCFHIFGLNVALALPLFAGGSVTLIEHFHPADTLRVVRDHDVTTIAAVPAIYDAWLALDERDAPSDAFKSVRVAVSGAAALPAGTVHAMRERFGVSVYEGYGLTEASPVVSTSAVDTRLRPGSIGPALPGVELRLVDADGADALVGDPGEIWVHGPNVFMGYWEDEDATRRVLTPDGWLRTGDIAVADDAGWLSLVDRAKDLVIVSGFNVYPAEVEDALIEHADVAEAAVIGEPHPRTGEAVVAFVVPEAGHTIDRRDLLRFAQARLARYKLPTRVEVVDELPRTFAGKLVRRALGSRARDDATTNPR